MTLDLFRPLKHQLAQLKAHTLVMTGLIALFSTGCGQGFTAHNLQESQNSKCALIECEANEPTPLPDDHDKALEKVDLEGTVSAGPFGKHKVVDIDKVQKLLIISLPLPINPFGAGFTIPIPNIPGSEIGIEINTTGSGYYLVAKLPLEYVLRGVKGLPVARLPNGSPLPGVPSGELPKLNLKFLKKLTDAALYLGEGAVGLYIPTPGFNPYVNLTFPIKNKSQRKTIGYFRTVAEKTPFDGGFYITIVLPKDVQDLLKGILP